MTEKDLGRVVGESAYEVAVRLGYSGTEQEWIESLKGERGSEGPQGPQGDKPVYGTDYLTPEEMNQLKAEITQNIQKGVDGKSAYEVAKQNGFVGTEQEWLLSLHGAKGDRGEPGPAGRDGADGKTPVKGVDYFDGVNGTNGTNGIDGKDGAPGAKGDTPVKGVDYWTAEDKQSIVNDTLSALPVWAWEAV